MDIKIIRSMLFSVRSAYWMLADTKDRREVWLEGRADASSSKVRQRRRLAQQSLPTADLLQHHNMSTNKKSLISDSNRFFYFEIKVLVLWGTMHTFLESGINRCIWALEDQDLQEVVFVNHEPDGGFYFR